MTLNALPLAMFGGQAQLDAILVIAALVAVYVVYLLYGWVASRGKKT